MKNIICILLAVFFFISECSADARVLAQLRAKSNARAKSIVSKSRQSKKKVSHQQPSCIPKVTKPKEVIVKEVVTKENLDIKNELAYLPNGDMPFTGKHEQYHSNGKKYVETNYKNGKKNGVLTMWDEYEHKVGQLSYVDDELLE